MGQHSLTFYDICTPKCIIYAVYKWTNAEDRYVYKSDWEGKDEVKLNIYWIDKKMFKGFIRLG